MLNIDVSLFRVINSLSGYPALDAFFYGITTFGIPVWTAGTLVLLLGPGRLPGLKGPGNASWRSVGVVMGISQATAGLLELILKDLVRRPRPSLVLTGVHVIGPLPPSFSFPSGHTLTAFAAAAVLMAAMQRVSVRDASRAPVAVGWVGIIFAGIIGFSRIYVGVHYPLDVLAGAILGWLLGWGAWRLFDRSPWLTSRGGWHYGHR